ncbi:MAG TPA: response regulator [Gemmatimonadaceae bacterium]|nr:response regulator [Gemmatimonadaceae bacterium]
MIRALIVDDEPLARRGIRQLLEAAEDVSVVGECRNGRDALAALDSLAPDLVFLDVQMPELDGFEVVRARGPARMPYVVFVTAYDEFAVKAFETHALDYLVKPVNEARFAAALDRVRERMRFAEALALSRRIGDLLAAQARRGGPPELAAATDDSARLTSAIAPARRLIVPTATGDLVLDVDEIDWIQAEDYYAAVHARGRRHLIRESLASLEQRLDPARFARVHRSAIVRLDRVREMRSAGAAESVLVLRDGTRVPVSRRRKEQVSALIRRTVR